MDATSLTATVTSSKYEVFISFRGEDTRNNFTSHLHAALRRRNIDSYMDERLERGSEISSTLLKVIEESRLSIVIFSRNYASSSWCLDELVHIDQCKENGHMVLPIFYHVDPSDVRKQKGEFAVPFAELKSRFNDKMDKVRQWEAALTATAGLSGWDTKNSRTDSELVQIIVEDVWGKLGKSSSDNFSDNLVGIGERVEYIKSLLQLDQTQDVRVIGIWGMAGIGKTTLARAVFKRLLSQFESSCFLANVRDDQLKHGLRYLEDKLFGELLGIRNPTTSDLLATKHRLSKKKVLVVLDDVNDTEQLERLAGNRDSFGLGSRIILTTRDRGLLRYGEIKIYEAEPLNFDEALCFFHSKVYKGNNITSDCRIEMSDRIINYARGIPLVLEVLSSLLRCKAAEEWESTVEKLIEKPPHERIQIAVRISYDGLDEYAKDTFLDIAAFFNGMDKDIVESIPCGHGHSKIDDLVDKSLVTIEDNKIRMHDLIQKIGWEIIRHKSKNPGEQSRLWIAEDVFHVLKNHKGAKSIEGISLDMHESEEVFLHPMVFKNMENLRILSVFNSEDARKCKLFFRQGLHHLPNSLRGLSWDGYPLKSLPSKFMPPHLVTLNISHSPVKQLCSGGLHLPKLKSIRLAYCEHLIRVPDLSYASKLESIDLTYCISLVQLPNFDNLAHLRSLNVSYCTSLVKLPNINLSSLTFLNLSGTALQELPEISQPMNLLTDLSSSKIAIKEIPASFIEYLNGLQYLNLDMCKYLEVIPGNIKNVTNLQCLSIRGCSKLKILPKLPLCLKYVDAQGCTSLEFVESSSRTTTMQERKKIQDFGGRFVFYDCLKLEQNIWNDIITDAQLKIMHAAESYSSKHRRDQEARVSTFSVCCPGNKVPKYFTYHSNGPSMSIKLPQAYFGTNFLGFTLCAVVDYREYSLEGNFILLCHLRCLTDNNDPLSWESCSAWGGKFPSVGSGHYGLFLESYDRHATNEIVKSGHVFLWDDYSHYTRAFVKRSANCRNATLAVSFELVFGDKSRERHENRMIKECGIHLLYAEDANKIPTTDYKRVKDGGFCPFTREDPTKISTARVGANDPKHIDDLSSLHEVGGIVPSAAQAFKSFGEGDGKSKPRLLHPKAKARHLNNKGQPLGKAGGELQSYLEVLVTDHIPIRFCKWKMVEKHCVDRLWEELCASFTISKREKNSHLALASKLWRCFKNYLYEEFVKDHKNDPHILKLPPTVKERFQKITDDDWSQFVMHHLSQRKIYEYDRYWTRGGRTTFDKIVEEETKLDTSIERSNFWKHARQEKKGNYKNKPAKIVANTNECCSAQNRQGLFRSDCEMDILSTTLNMPCHFEQTRSEKQMTYFESRQDSASSRSKEIEELWVGLNKVMNICEQLQKDIYTPKHGSTTPNGKVVITTRGEANCVADIAPSSSLVAPINQSQALNLWIGEGKPCRLVGVANEGYCRIVARGLAYLRSKLGDTLHSIHLGKENLRVVVQDPKVPDAKLPFPTNEFQTVIDACGRHIAWPRDWVLFDQESSLKHGKGPSNIILQPQQSKGNMNKKEKRKGKTQNQVATKLCSNDLQSIPPLLGPVVFYTQNFMDSESLLQFEMSREVVGHQHTIWLDREDILQFATYTEISAACIALYVKALYLVCCEHGILNKFGFVCPSRMAFIPQQVGEDKQAGKVTFLFEVLKHAQEGQQFFLPYNGGSHWILVLVNPWAHEAYWIDPIRQGIRGDLKAVVERALKMFNSHVDSGMNFHKLHESTKWIKIKSAPRQPGNVECGYYVLRYMRDIIYNRWNPIPTNFGGITDYTIKHLDEMRDEWGRHVQTLIQWKISL